MYRTKLRTVLAANAYVLHTQLYPRTIMVSLLLHGSSVNNKDTIQVEVHIARQNKAFYSAAVAII